MAIERKSQHGTGAQSTPTLGWALAGVAILAIWAGVVLASAFAPDFVSGSQQDHLALVAGSDWVWGLIATSFVLLAAQDGVRSKVVNLAPWIGLALSVTIIWAAVAFISATAPVFVTGSDPTRIPMAALGIPIVGTFMTWFACTFVKSLFDQYKTS
jgi:hypothetical protein